MPIDFPDLTAHAEAEEPPTVVEQQPAAWKRRQPARKAKGQPAQTGEVHTEVQVPAKRVTRARGKAAAEPKTDSAPTEIAAPADAGYNGKGKAAAREVQEQDVCTSSPAIQSRLSEEPAVQAHGPTSPRAPASSAPGTEQHAEPSESEAAAPASGTLGHGAPPTPLSSAAPPSAGATPATAHITRSVTRAAAAPDASSLPLQQASSPRTAPPAEASSPTSVSNRGLEAHAPAADDSAAQQSESSARPDGMASARANSLGQDNERDGPCLGRDELAPSSPVSQPSLPALPGSPAAQAEAAPEASQASPSPNPPPREEASLPAAKHRSSTRSVPVPGPMRSSALRSTTTAVTAAQTAIASRQSEAAAAPSQLNEPAGTADADAAAAHAELPDSAPQASKQAVALAVEGASTPAAGSVSDSASEPTPALDSHSQPDAQDEQQVLTGSSSEDLLVSGQGGGGAAKTMGGGVLNLVSSIRSFLPTGAAKAADGPPLKKPVRVRHRLDVGCAHMQTCVGHQDDLAYWSEHVCLVSKLHQTVLHGLSEGW